MRARRAIARSRRGSRAAPGSRSVMTPMTSSPARIGTPSQDSATIWPSDRSGAVRLVRGPEAERPALPDDDRCRPGPSSKGSGVVPLALLDLVRERDDVGRRRRERDVHRRRVVRPPDALADELDDRLEVEVLDEAAADLVDQRELHVPLADRVDRRARASADATWRPTKVTSSTSSAVYELVLDVRLHDEDADRPRPPRRAGRRANRRRRRRALEQALGRELGDVAPP